MALASLAAGGAKVVAALALQGASSPKIRAR
jgi:hypothetical protein